MAKQIILKCKNCNREFGYSENAYRLMAEKGNSRLERCQDCLQIHGREIKETESPYFEFKKESDLPLSFNFSETEFGFRGERTQEEKIKLADQSGMDISITDKEIVTLYQMLEDSQVVVLTSPTGTGKSTYIPKRLIQAPESYVGDFVERLLHQGQIIITQPRILATLQTAKTTARISGEEIGPYDLFGSRHSGEDRSSFWNRVISITDGTLPNWIRQGKLGQYSLVMIDECHERSLNIDIILSCLKRELPKYPQLRVIISSATINAQKLLDTFKEGNISVSLLDIPSRKKCKKYRHFWKDKNPVEGCDCWLCKMPKKERQNFWETQKEITKEYDLPEVCTNFVLTILSETGEGSILVFLHGEGPIKETVRRLKVKCKRNIEIIPVYSKIQEWAEAELKRTEGKRRVIIATNIAETSITIPDLVYGINAGWIKQIEWDPNTQIQKLRSKLHTKDGNKQREGRLGRNQDGYVYHLLTKKQWDEELEEHTSPEITRSCLDDSLTTLIATGVGKIDQFSWIEKPAECPNMAQEIKRAQKSLQDREIVDQKGDIVEKTLELLGIPRSSTEASFLFLADEQGLLFETMTFLMLMSTRDGEARTGANLYNPHIGLLLWNPEMTAKTKANIYAIHQGLKTGCQDDLDFVIKLAWCFQRMKSNGLSREWAEYHFVNYENLTKLLSDIDELIITIFGEERQESFRELDLESLDRIRLLISSTWPDRITDLSLIIISAQCAGDWKVRKKALAMSFVDEETLINAYPQRTPVASFMVTIPEQVQKEDLFIDQRFPIGSIVEVKEEKGKTYLSKLEKVPSEIRVSNKKSVWSSEEKNEMKVSFDRRFILDEDSVGCYQGIWFGKNQSGRAKILEWKRGENSIPVAILSPFTESDISISRKEKEDPLRVNIHRIVRDPIGRNGWISVRTPIHEIPVELNELSLSDWGAGLEQLEGRIFNLTVQAVDNKGNLQLSNINRVIQDLNCLREQVVVEKEINLEGHIEEIREEEEKAVVIVPRAFGVVHSFEVHQDFIPGKQVTNLRVGEDVIVRFSLPSTQEDHVRGECFVKEEICALPDCLRYDDKNDEMLFSYCLDKKDLTKWTARPEVIDFVWRHSWRYCLQVKIVSLKERLSNLREKDLVEGIIQQVNYEEGGTKVKSLQVLINDNTPGFVFNSDLGSLSVSRGDSILFYIKAVDPKSGFLRLASLQSEDEKKNKQKEFVRRTQAHIKRWQSNIIKAKDVIKRKKASITKINQNIAVNRVRVNTARSKEWEHRFILWIEEGENKVKIIEKEIKNVTLSINNWLDKIESVRKKLR